MRNEMIYYKNFFKRFQYFIHIDSRIFLIKILDISNLITYENKAKYHKRKDNIYDRLQKRIE